MPRKQDKAPWGQHEEIGKGAGYRIDRITLKPDQRINLHRHEKRTETWVVVSGKAWVVLGNAKDILFTHELPTGRSVRITRNMLHGISNPGKTPLVVIEVQTGELDERDAIPMEGAYEW